MRSTFKEKKKCLSSPGHILSFKPLHSKQPKLHGVLAVLSAIGLNEGFYYPGNQRSQKLFSSQKLVEKHGSVLLLYTLFDFSK